MSASTTERASSRKKPDGLPSEASETRSLVFEWPLYGLRQMFDGSKSDTKSKVVKSVPFGGGRWTVLFYAQSGHEQFCSLYLNAEPLAHERVRPLIAGAQSPATNDAREGAAAGGSSSKGKSGAADGDDKWSREGLFRFTFEIQPLDKSGATKLGTKEAHDHAFSHKTSNWGWAQFAKRDTVYYSQPQVKQADGFLISVTITANAERPRPRAPVFHTVPPVLISAMGSLLDDPEHSDVVFHIAQPRGRSGRRTVPKKIYAIKKILASRSEYFADMFNGGFAEAERAEDSEEEEEAGLLLRSRSPLNHTPAHPQGAPQMYAADSSSGRAAAALYGERAMSHIEVDDYERGPEALLEDSDEELDDDADCWSLATPPPASSIMGGAAAAPASADGLHKSGADMSDEDEDDEVDDDRPVEDDVIQFGAGKSTGGGDAGISSNMHSPVIGGGEGELAVSSDQGRSGTWASTAAGAGDATMSTTGARTPAQQQRLVSTTLQVTGDRSMSGSTTPSRQGAGAAASASPAHHVDGATRALLQSAKRDRPDAAAAAATRRSASDRRKRRKVVVRDSSYATFKALLFFLYTNAIEFAPLTSSFLPPDVSDDASSDSTSALPTGGREASSRGGFLEEIVRAHKKRQMVIDQYCAEHPDKPAPCSAKAMYKLADKLQIEDLKKRAQEHIASSLTVQNIVWEAFSGFNAQYPDIMQMEVDFLLKHWASVKNSPVMQTIFTRPTAHPGLAYVWPRVLRHLSVNADDEAAAEDSRAVIAL